MNAVFDIKKRDVTARVGILKVDDSVFQTPAVLDIEKIFPNLFDMSFTNLPMSASKDDADRYFVSGTEPYIVHPNSESKNDDSKIYLFANWKSVLSDSKRYAGYLEKFYSRLHADSAKYAPACALPSNAASLIYTGFDIFDYTAVDLCTIQKKFCMAEGIFDESYMEKGVCSCEGCKKGDLKLHNRLALEREIAVAKTWIERNQMREFMEMRCRLSAEQTSLLRYLDRSTVFDSSYPAAKSSRFLANSSESMTRREIDLFEERLISRFIPSRNDVCVLLPCAARKPYSLSHSHQLFTRVIDGRAHEVIVTSPLGIVPRELELVYPAGHYDVPVTGYWDREELEIISGYIAAYLSKHKYERVICHLEGGAKAAAEAGAKRAGVLMEYTCNDDHPLSQESLRSLNSALESYRRKRCDYIRGTLLWQFGCDVDTKGWITKGRYPNQKIYEKKTQIFSIDSGTGMLRPTMQGWKFISGYRVRISDDLEPKGDILVPGVIFADEYIREGDEVLVEGNGYLAAGKASMSAFEMEKSRRGVAVKVRKTVRK